MVRRHELEGIARGDVSRVAGGGGEPRRVCLAERRGFAAGLAGERAREELDVGEPARRALQVVVARGLDLLLAHRADGAPQALVAPRVELVLEDARGALREGTVAGRRAQLLEREPLPVRGLARVV